MGRFQRLGETHEALILLVPVELELDLLPRYRAANGALWDRGSFRIQDLFFGGDLALGVCDVTGPGALRCRGFSVSRACSFSGEQSPPHRQKSRTPP